ncbi:acetyl-CoA carboxylase carboxyl transferase subunit alpha [Helicobacter pylori]|uniref:Acetyl-coenzyme A carboxylase carboxyl transferase subunit alpha n=1 Tax=Helicobacter pylori TaxID=210 RepID=A0AB73QD13_HELPX|nr:acetyl-CoA carboxylase carboxyl transferase subunit alpha [Helicobacter pylori]MDU9718246.1 acetyl-CoA carboxylase carboxyl transferase subunit alpha [Helicobacter pylori]PDW28805.1 acetyl-CoA carboxylase carboxyltransferase subunit alpha [Helicobacter pylori]RVY23241.1 acetyl-CoA carboxylase carboxyl transferase subunit alpha [Helicobacter pylori]WQY57338.1 acetyl-CoA carboxylase carboxyl transferase subunit alpha [Helicobacter pylori]
MAVYLDFENHIKEIQNEIELALIRGDEDAKEILEKRLDKEVKSIYSNLTDFQKLQLARHPDRPYAMDYIDLILKDKYEVFGDRHYNDDKAIVCFIGKIDSVPVVVIGEEKGRGTKNKLLRNFGMPNPCGYRKALKMAKFAEKFNLPILMLVDTAGAYPGIGAEERGQSEAIAKNLQEFASLKVPTISVIIGEGGSGGALAIAVADKLAMMEYSIFSVISPEGCAAILWDDPSKTEVAIKAMKITPRDLKEAGLIDDIILEPSKGAHRDKFSAANTIKEYFLDALRTIQQDPHFLDNRYQKLMSLGSFVEGMN